MRYKALLLVIVILGSVVVALLAAILRASGGSGVRVAIEIGATAFTGSVVLGLSMLNSAGAL